MEICEEMTMAEIEARFDSEWVLINDPVVNEQKEVLGGVVRFHSADRDEVHEATREIGSNRIAVRYIGDLPSNVRFLLNWRADLLEP